METVSNQAWWGWVVSGQWQPHQEELLALLAGTPPGMKVGRVDDEGKTALHHLLLHSLTPEAFETNVLLLDALSAHALSPWQADRAGRRPYWDLIEHQACSEVLMWCWTRSMEPGHAEVGLSRRIASDRLDWILRAHPVAGSAEQTHARQMHGLSLDGRWADGSTTLRRLLGAGPRPDEASSPGMVFQGLVGLMRECIERPCFSDEPALLGVWWAHAHALPPPGSLAALAEQWMDRLRDKCHGCLPGNSDRRRWAWEEWQRWVGERSASPAWAGYAALTACRVAQGYADTEGLEAARACLLEGIAGALVLWEPRAEDDAWATYAWGQAWELWVRWAIPSAPSEPRSWALVLPLAQRPDVLRWMRAQPVLPPLPSDLPEAWTKRAEGVHGVSVGRSASSW